jgi:hypothetical protein
MPDAVQYVNVWAAAWSAIAATFAAIAAVLLWRTEQQSFRHSARPELVLAGWQRFQDTSGGFGPERIAFSTIENVGRGPALHVHINSFSIADDDRPKTVMSTIRESLIATGSRVTVQGVISIWWNNVAGSPGSKSVPISIDMLSWDTTGIRYCTKYKLLVVELSPHVVVADAIAPGVILATRTVTQAPVWRLKLNRSLSKVPLLGRCFRSE